MVSETEQLITDTSELYSKEIEYIIEQFDNDPIGYWRRSFVKTVISFVEAELHILKSELLSFSDKNAIPLAFEVRMFLEGKSYRLTDKGKIRETFAGVRLVDDIRFVFDQHQLIKGHEFRFSYGDAGWTHLKNTIRVRNRLTHPSNVEEQTVTDQEREECFQAVEWFFHSSLSFVRQDTENIQAQIKEIEDRIKGDK